jgi:uncharacterized membrane protein YecN with MAPEG domain
MPLLLPKITLFYAALHALLLAGLSLWIVQRRHAAQVGLGDGGDKVLSRRIRVQANFVEYVPLALLLLALLELSGLQAYAVWLLGGVLLLARLLHAFGLGRRPARPTGVSSVPC